MTDRLISLNAAIELAKEHVANGQREPLIWALEALPDASDTQMMADLLLHGCHITRDGERIDPLDFYAEPPK